MNYKIYLFILLFSIILFSNFTRPTDIGPHPYQFNYPEHFGKAEIPADNPFTVEGIWLGRLLFYDSVLSIDRKNSCASCHKQSLSFTDGRVLALGVHGDTLARNSMSLVNLAWSKYFFWDGRVRNLEDLVKEPIGKTKEMGGLTEEELIQRLKQHEYYPILFKNAFPGEEISMRTISKALAQFLRTIASGLNEIEEFHKSDPRFGNEDFFDSVLNESSLRGLVARGSVMPCKGCHTTPGFGGQLVTVFPNDSVFKAVSLMNIRYTAPYMHDGRFKTMREVLQFYNDSTDLILAKNPKISQSLDTIVKKYLKKVKFTQYDLEHADDLFIGFEDTTILTNPILANPFKQKGFTWMGIKNK